MRIPDAAIDEVKARALVSDVAREIGGVQLRRRGHELVGLCPFHADRSPSMTVNDAKGLYKCFACGAGGDAIGFVMDLLTLDFPQAVARIAPLYGVQVEAAAALPPAEEAARKAALEHRRTGLALVRAVREAMDLRKVLQVADGIWRAADSGQGSPATGVALRYLKSRGIELRGLPRIMRGHRALWHAESRRNWPGIVTRLDGPYGFHGVHRTFLAEDAKTGAVGKAPVENAKMTLGSVFETGACARLQSATEGRVALVEGLENALIFAQALKRGEVHRSRPSWPVWSVLALEGFRRVALPPSIETVLIVPDADESDREAAEAVIQDAIARLQGEGRQVLRFATPEGHDLDSMRMVPAVSAELGESVF